MPETLWINRVKEFGNLIIPIDTMSNNLLEKNKVRRNKRSSQRWSGSSGKWPSSSEQADAMKPVRRWGE